MNCKVYWSGRSQFAKPHRYHKKTVLLWKTQNSEKQGYLFTYFGSRLHKAFLRVSPVLLNNQFSSAIQAFPQASSLLTLLKNEVDLKKIQFWKPQIMLISEQYILGQQFDLKNVEGVQTDCLTLRIVCLCDLTLRLAKGKKDREEMTDIVYPKQGAQGTVDDNTQSTVSTLLLCFVRVYECKE